MPQKGVSCGLSTPWGPYGKTLVQQNMVRVKAHGGQHIKKSASYPFAKVMFLTETCFFQLFLDFFENILFQSKSQAFIRTKRDALYR